MNATPTYKLHQFTYPRYYLCLSLLPPLHNLGVDLFPNFALNLSRVSREESQESLGTAVDDIHLMERNGVDNLLTLLELTLRTLNKLCLQRKIDKIN